MYSNKILGHKNVLNRLKALLLSKRIPPSMIFNGRQGVGKFIVAKEFAKSINCSHEKPQEDNLSLDLFQNQNETEKKSDSNEVKPCDNCQSCKQIEVGAHPDVRIIDSSFQGFLLDEDIKKQKKLKIDTVREFSKYAYKRPLLSEHKVFIVNDADTLTTEAQNAMLKLLEEPPKNTFFILISSQKNTFLPTVLSRCHIMEFGPLSNETVEEILARNNISLDEAALLSKFSGGAVKTALDMKTIMEKLQKLDTSSTLYPFKISSMLPKESYLAREEARLILNILLTKTHQKWITINDSNQKTDLKNLIKETLKLKTFLNQNVMPTPIIELAASECLKHGITLGFMKKYHE
ncbi:MAG: DNA polymerase III subunit delta' [Elusimicrobia bacterium]|nr:DNA polymerase III subunit delta' [Elusimicrobiota bacterium]